MIKRKVWALLVPLFILQGSADAVNPQPYFNNDDKSCPDMSYAVIPAAAHVSTQVNDDAQPAHTISYLWQPGAGSTTNGAIPDLSAGAFTPASGIISASLGNPGFISVDVSNPTGGIYKGFVNVQDQVTNASNYKDFLFWYYPTVPDPTIIPNVTAPTVTNGTFAAGTYNIFGAEADYQMNVTWPAGSSLHNDKIACFYAASDMDMALMTQVVVDVYPAGLVSGAARHLHLGTNNVYIRCSDGDVLPGTIHSPGPLTATRTSTLITVNAHPYTTPLQSVTSSPSGTIAYTPSVNLSLTTDRDTKCKYPNVQGQHLPWTDPNMLPFNYAPSCAYPQGESKKDSGLSPTTVPVIVGDNHYYVRCQDDLSGEAEVDIHFTVAAPLQPAIHLDQNALNFTAVQGQASDPSTQLVTLTNTGDAGTTLSWTLDTSSLPSWLSPLPTPASVQFKVDPTSPAFEIVRSCVAGSEACPSTAVKVSAG